MAIVSKEILDKAFENEAFKSQVFDSLYFGVGFVDVGVGGVKHVRLEDVFISCYQSKLNEWKAKSAELKLATSLEF